MKKLFLAIAIILPLIAHAESLPETVCGSGEQAFCQNITSNTQILSYSPTYGSLYVIVGGVQYIGTAPRFTDSFKVTVKNPKNGSTKLVTVSFSKIHHRDMVVWVLDTGEVS